MNGDPRLPSDAPTNLPKNKYLLKVQEGNGSLVIFSDSLPRLTYVDSNNRVAQMSEVQREALGELRKVVEELTVTSPDAPPRVAVFSRWEAAPPWRISPSFQ